ncbi:hypothetical protein [Microcystis phage Mea-Yong924-1]|nr:hypothetical protein [Microcystis phage Mea-Yong924-1]
MVISSSAILTMSKKAAKCTSLMVHVSEVLKVAAFDTSSEILTSIVFKAFLFRRAFLFGVEAKIIHKKA